MQAIILAGGKGTRLKPYTTVFPKPLMPIGDYPILDVVIQQLKYYGFTDVILAVGHMRELFEAFFGNGKKWGVNMSYSFENKPLGTAAPIKLIKDLNDEFLVMNGDVLTDIDFAEFMKFHKSKDTLCTIAMYPKPVKVDLGVLKVDEHNNLQDYIEKPTLHYQVSMGVYAFKKAVLDYLPENEYFDFPDLIKALLKDDESVAGFPFSGNWLDIGRPEDYSEAIKKFDEKKNLFLKGKS